MAREESDSMLVSDVEALLRIVGQERLAAEHAARVLDGLCKLLAARGVEVGEAVGIAPTAAGRRPAASRAGAARTPVRAALDDGGRRLCCVGGAGGRPTRFQFQRGRRDGPFGTREMTIVATMARANWLRPGGFDGFDKLTAGRLGAGPIDRFGGFDALTAGRLTAGRLTTGKPSSPRVLTDLTSRRYEVLDRLRHGASGKEVARSLHVSIDTVKFHVRHLLRRFDVSSRPELIARVFCGDDAKPPLGPLTGRGG